MAILNILKDYDNNEALRKKSRKVEKIDERIKTLLNDMKETMLIAGGVGLAAPQVGVLRRVILVDNGEKIIELINPEIIKDEESQEGVEACLSVPFKYGIVKRPMKVTVRAMDRNGKEFITTGEGITARAFCHEIDHLNGVLYTDLATEMYDKDDKEE